MKKSVLPQHIKGMKCPDCCMGDTMWIIPIDGCPVPRITCAMCDRSATAHSAVRIMEEQQRLYHLKRSQSFSIWRFIINLIPGFTKRCKVLIDKFRADYKRYQDWKLRLKYIAK